MSHQKLVTKTFVTAAIRILQLMKVNGRRKKRALLVIKPFTDKKNNKKRTIKFNLKQYTLKNEEKGD